MRFFGVSLGIFGIVFAVVSLLTTAVFIIVLVKVIGQWNENGRSPRLTVPAVITGKRTSVTRHRAAGSSMVHTSTFYYVTFQVESGDRMELSVSGSEYGMLAEGDHGKLSFQGTRYLGFERGS